MGLQVVRHDWATAHKSKMQLIMHINYFISINVSSGFKCENSDIIYSIH